MVAPGKEPIYEYTLMPTHMWKMFSERELRLAEMADPFDFTKGCPVLKIPAAAGDAVHGSFNPQDEEEMITALFDLEIDPGEARPIKDDEVERYMRDWMVQVMEANNAPNELFVRMGLGAFRAG